MLLPDLPLNQQGEKGNGIRESLPAWGTDTGSCLLKG